MVELETSGWLDRLGYEVQPATYDRIYREPDRVRRARMVATRMRLPWIASAVLAAALTAGVAGASARDAAEERGIKASDGPIVYAIVIDGLDGDAVDEGKAPFISSMLGGGEGASATYFEESRSVMPTVTNANHTAMMTGAYAGDSGIAGNEFALYAPLENGDSCASTGPENLKAVPTTTSGENLNCPQAEMVFEAIKRQGNPGGLVTAGIFGKPKLGRIFAGRNVDPDSRDVDYLWAPCASGPDDDEYCGQVETNPITGYGLDDAQVMDEVVRASTEGVPAGGAMERPDFTFVNLHQVDSAGHLTGRSAIYDTAVGMADDQIERLVTTLKSAGEWERTVMIILSDHAMEAVPTKVNLESVIEDAGVPADQFSAVMGDNASAAHIYLADRESDARFTVAKQIRDALAAHPSVADALYREPNPEDGGNAHTLAGERPDWHVEGERSGDIFVDAKAGTIFGSSSSINNFASGAHGSSSTRDNFFAVLGGSPLIRQGAIAGAAAPNFDDTADNPEQAENVDVAATVMGLFGLFAPDDNAGRFLKQAFDKKLLKETAKPETPKLRIKGGGGKLTLRFRPEGGLYDLQLRDGGGWDKLLKKSSKEKLKVRGEKGEKATFRLRSISAAGVKSAWRKATARF